MIALPQYIDKEAWAAFLEVRAKLKAPNTDYAQKLLVYELQRLKDAGHDPTECINQSIVKGYKDLYAPKDKRTEASGRLPEYHAVERASTPPPDGWLAQVKGRLRSVK